jgi:hypothetical protein
MPLSWDEIQQNAITFARRWKDGWDEKSEAQSFVRDFLRVFGAEDAAAVGRFEERAQRESGRGFMDYFWPKKIAIEMKSKGRDLNRAYTQLVDYLSHLPEDEIPELWMVSDFETIVLWRRSTKQRKQFKTKDLKKNIRQFADIAGLETQRVDIDQLEVNVKAAEMMARLHDALKEHGYEGHDLEVYLVRLLFCLFAEDTGIFSKNSFGDYIEFHTQADGSDLSYRIAELFEVLNQSPEARVRRTLLKEELKQFNYINGKLFETRLPSADFNAKMRAVLLDCSRKFDWDKISPAIFGAMFQGVMDSKQRRELGAHYTSEENILKLINPLFLDSLWEEFERVKYDPKLLEAFHRKIANLKFLDPACGCGNFLIVTYGELRRLEFAILKMKLSESAYTQLRFGDNPLEREILCNVDQFYGIEYEDFPCQIAQVGLWLTDHQWNNEVAEHFGIPFVRLPLRQSATIAHGNALRLDWEGIVPKAQLSYVLGNPPFVGARIMSPEQKADVLHIFGDVKNAGNLDYVAAWYYNTAKIISTQPRIRAAFVSTNSITQGEQVAILWKPIMEQFGLHIDFGYRTFKWSNEAKGKAAVHCVIVGFSATPGITKRVYDGEEKIEAQNINGYLVDASSIFLESRKKPLCNVPEIGIGNKPVDGGNYLFTEEEKAEFLLREPQAEKWFRPWIGSHEFINHYFRYCLWLGNCSPTDLRKMPEAMKRIEAVRQFRLNSDSTPTQKIAETPTRFHVENIPTSTYIVVPKVSSERRKYIPIGYITPNIMSSDLVFIIPNATLYHFGLLTSNVHNAWARAVCGRLKSDYRYSKDIVYNNFPWPTLTEAQKTAIEAAAQGVLNARAAFPDCSLADLYDPNTMPPELNKAHKKLDKAVWAAYGFTPRTHPSEAAVVAALMEMWRGMAG